MNKTLKAVLRWVGYVAFFVFALILCVRFTFPTDQAREFVKARIAEATGAEKVDITKLGISGILPSGVTLKGLTIELPPLKVKTPERGVDVLGEPRTISADELSVSGSVMGMLGGNYDVELEGKVQGGEIDGGHFTFEKGGPMTAEIAEMKGIDLGSESLFQTLTGFDVVGTLGGHMNVEVPTADKDGKPVPQYAEIDGEVELELADAKVVQPIFDTVMNKEPVRMAFTDTRLGTVHVKLKTEQGGGAAAAATGAGDAKGAKRKGESTIVSIEDLSATGGDIELAVAPKSTITLQPGQSLKDAIVNIHLAVKINDSWFDTEIKDPKDPTKKTKPNVGVRTMLTLGPLKQHVQDGQFGIGITGPLSKPKVVPERPRTRVGGTNTVGSAGRKMNVDRAGDGGGDEESEDDSGKPKHGSATPSEPKGKPVATPPLGGNDRRPPIVRPPVMGKGVPGVGATPPGGLPGSGQIVRPRPKLIPEPVATPETSAPEPAAEPPPPEGGQEQASPPADGTAPPEGGGGDQTAPPPEGGGDQPAPQPD